MSLDDALDISLSGVKAQEIAMEYIASNLANINTTRSIYGGPYRRLIPILEEQLLTFAQSLTLAEEKLQGGGVKIGEVTQDNSPFPKIYNPGHPDADSAGFVSLPNVKLSQEMTDLIYTSKLYEANITAFNATKKMMQDTLQIP